VLSLGGELIANDKPLVVSYQGQLVLPGVQALHRAGIRRRTAVPGRLSQRVRAELIEGRRLDAVPPIPFSDDTPNYDLNQPAPSPPSRSTGWAPTIRRATCWRG
jgi:microcin C transport system permease protein